MTTDLQPGLQLPLADGPDPVGQREQRPADLAHQHRGQHDGEQRGEHRHHQEAAAHLFQALIDGIVGDQVADRQHQGAGGAVGGAEQVEQAPPAGEIQHPGGGTGLREALHVNLLQLLRNAQILVAVKQRRAV